MNFLKSKKILFKTYWLTVILIILSVTGCAMTGMQEIFIQHFDKYPEMEIKDYYKLLYQAEFGVKHLLVDTVKSKTYLIKELNSIEPKDENLYEYISNDKNIIRLNLNSAKFRGIPVDVIFNAMKLSAEEINGNETKFFEKWHELKELVKAKKINLGMEKIIGYETGFSSPLREEHHSEQFVKLYAPHYRVVLKTIFEKLYSDK